MEAREVRGLQIATDATPIQSGQVWIVPSQSSAKNYIVDLQARSCTCPDHVESGLKCKHLFAAEYTVERERGEALPSPPKLVKPTYKQAWPAYNLAQTNEKSRFLELLYHLCFEIEDLPRKPGAGRSRLPLKEMIFCAVFKVYSTISGRRFISDLREA